MKRAGLLVLALPGPLAAAGEAVAAVPVAPTVIALVIVVAVILAVAFLVKRVGMRPGGSAPSLIEPVASLSLGARERVVVVRVAGRGLVLGVTANAISVLDRLESTDLPAPAASPAFAAALSRALGRHGTP